MTIKKLILSLSLLTLVPSTALAADPTVAGSTSIGTHPTYGSGYSAFWRKNLDYSLLTDGTSTFLNAPSVDGTIWFRGNNNNWMALNKNGLTLNKQLLLIGPLVVSGTSTFNNAVTVNNTLLVESTSTFQGDATFNGNTTFNSNSATFNGSLIAFPYMNNWTAVFAGNDYGISTQGAVYGLYTTGTTYAIYANGPAYVLGNETIEYNLTLNQGKAYKPGGGSFLATSDRRVKKDILEFKLGLPEVERLHPVLYRYNGLGGTVNSDRQYVGVIAQEVEQVAPLMVSSQKKKLHKEDKQTTEIKEVDPSAFTYMLVNAVQDLAGQNKELRRIVCQDHPTDKFCHPSEVAGLKAETHEIASTVR